VGLLILRPGQVFYLETGNNSRVPTSSSTTSKVRSVLRCRFEPKRREPGSMLRSTVSLCAIDPETTLGRWPVTELAGRWPDA
jgi:hypothetical protein